MYPSKDARELAILLRISRELDIVGDTSATVDNPSELLAWATILTNPAIVAWHAKDSGNRFLQVTADHERAPVRGRVTAVLPGDHHPSSGTPSAWTISPLAAANISTPRPSPTRGQPCQSHPPT